MKSKLERITYKYFLNFFEFFKPGKIFNKKQKQLDQEISEKNSLVKLLESKIYDIKVAHNK